jgi:hypothetical protein
MRFMVIVKANKDSEAGVMPPPELFEQMGRFNEELVKAGVMLAGEGLLPTAQGARIKFGGQQPEVKQGPFDLTNDTIAGFWLIKTRSREEAIEWMKKAPFGGGEIELRQIAELEDFGNAVPDDVKKQEVRLREQLEKQQKSA